MCNEGEGANVQNSVRRSQGEEMNVLVVADDPNLAILWGGALKEGGHEVIVVDTEGAALGALQDKVHDLVVMDLCVKGRNGIGLAAHARSLNPACKVIVVSGAAEYSREALDAMSPAVTATLRKPVDIEDLVVVCGAMSPKERLTPISLMDVRGMDLRARRNRRDAKGGARSSQLRINREIQ